MREYNKEIMYAVVILINLVSLWVFTFRYRNILRHLIGLIQENVADFRF